MSKTLMVVDGNSLMHRAFYALPIMTTSTGEYTNAVYGFFAMLIRALDTLKPDYLAIAFDKKGKTFRHDMFTEYKGKRKPTPEELIPQFPMLKTALEDLSITTLESAGYEADDILGALSKNAERNGCKSVLLTGDKDTYQLVSDSCNVLMTRKGVSELDLIDAGKLNELYSLTAAQIVDLKGFMGDSSDNIPGVPGVGEKTALKLLHAYSDMDGVYSHIDEIKGKLKEKLVQNRDQAYLSRQLATIDTQMPLDVSIESLAFSSFNEDTTRSVFERLEFGSLLKRLSIDKTPKQEITQISIDNMTDLTRTVANARSKDFVAITFSDHIMLAVDSAQEYTITAEHSLLNMDFTADMVMDTLKPLLEDAGVPKVLHGAKQASAMLKEYDIKLDGLLFDTKLAEYALNPGATDYSLEKTADKYNLSGTAAAIAALYPLQKELLEKNGLWFIYNDIEFPLTNVLRSMEDIGFRVDLDALADYSQNLYNQIEGLTKDIYDLCGYDDFNINSTKQLGNVLFERLSLPALKKTKTGYSTNIEVLEKLSGKHPVIEKIIAYRQLTKLKSTYIDGLKKIADPNGFIHTTFVQISTVTGRISSKEPNLQNIPIRTAEGRQIRRLFLPSTDTRKLVTADYSQIELRILASISGDSVMQSAFSSGIDIHTRTASEVLGVPLDAVSEEMRRSAKAVNFGIVYGISDFGLARNLGIPVKEAASYIQRYFLRFPGVAQYMDDIKMKAASDGYVTTLLGRRRYLPELKSKNYNIRSFGERAALNTPIQGTAADIIKLAMIDVSKKLTDGGYKSNLILQVHDELIIDTVADEITAVSKLLSECMENAYKLDVPLLAKVAVGDNWLDAK